MIQEDTGYDILDYDTDLWPPHALVSACRKGKALLYCVNFPAQQYSRDYLLLLFIRLGLTLQPRLACTKHDVAKAGLKFIAALLFQHNPAVPPLPEC